MLLKDVSRWVEQSDEEADTAKINYKAGKYFSAAFWCQQSVEKAFKALLIKKTGKFPKIHDLTRLARLVHAPLWIVELCSKINPAYTNTRYPDLPKKISKEECRAIMKYSGEVLQWLKANLGS